MRRSVAFFIGVSVTGLTGQAAASDFTAAIVPEDRITRDATWRFFRGRTEPPGGDLAWTRAGYDDSAWETGTAGFGYGDDDDVTVLADMEDNYTSVYLRKDFDVADPDQISTLQLSIDYDDGFVAFLNGREAARANAGPPGEFPAHDDRATDSHEAGTAQSFTVVDARSFLLPGTNVLAVVGLNGDIDSSDFSLHPALRSDGILAAGCSNTFYVGRATVLISGTVPPAAGEVRVNGAVAALDSLNGTWSHRVHIPGSSLDITAEARDTGGWVLAGVTLTARRVNPIGGNLDGDVTLPATARPYLIVDWLTVPAERRLAIQAGCEFLIRPGIGLAIHGEVQALGTAANPIRFTRVPCQENWGFFTFQRARGTNTFLFCEWSYGGGDPGCLTLTESNLELYGCTLRDIDGEGVHAVDSMTRIRNCLTERTEEALSLDFGDTVVEFCTVRDITGKSDLVDVNGSPDNPPARIAFNHIYNTPDDGIDADGGTIIIEGNVIHHCGDQAMSLVGGTSSVRFNVCYENEHGLSVKDSHECLAEHNTFAFNAETGVRAIEKNEGRGGGIITLHDSIVWGNDVQLLVESTGSIDVAHSDVEGMVPPGLGNISADPIFVDPAAGDFNLQENSPCIGTASDGGNLGALPLEAIPGLYLRGDANVDGQRDLADAIWILAFLYEGGAAPLCSDIADTNADRRVDLSDPIFLLLYLFGRGGEPTPNRAYCSP